MKKGDQWDEEMQVGLRTNFYYIPETGEIGRRFDSTRAKAGPLTSRNPTGDLQTNFLWKGKIHNLRANRLAYFLHTGTQPAEVQYIDYDKKNLKFDNLRAKFSRDQIVQPAAAPLDYVINVPQPAAAANAEVEIVRPRNEPLVNFTVPKPRPRPRDDLFDELFIYAYNKGNMTFNEERGTLWRDVTGEILPKGYTYKDKSPEEQARLRAGWKALLYYVDPIDAVGNTQAQLDRKNGLEYLYKTGQQVSPAYDVDIKQVLLEAGDSAVPVATAATQESNKWGDI